MLFNEKFTIFHFADDDSLEKYVFDKCYSHTTSGIRLSKDASEGNNVNCLILYQDNISKINVGDLIVLEEVNPLYTLEREIRQHYKTYIIQSIQDCKQGNLPHYELMCK